MLVLLRDPACDLFKIACPWDVIDIQDDQVMDEHQKP